MSSTRLTFVLILNVRKSVRCLMYDHADTSEARERLYRLIDETAAAHEPTLIRGPRANAVLISEDDWRSVQETLYLLSITSMRESIREGLAAALEDCEAEPGW